MAAARDACAVVADHASLLERWADTVNRAYTHGCADRRDHLLAAVAPARGASRRFRRVRRGAGARARSGLRLAVAGRVRARRADRAPGCCCRSSGCGTSDAAFGAAVLRRACGCRSPICISPIPVWDAFDAAAAMGVGVRGARAAAPGRHPGVLRRTTTSRFPRAASRSRMAAAACISSSSASPSPCSTARCTRHARARASSWWCSARCFALVTNWLRISIIVVAGHLTNMQHYLVSGEHYSFGWGMFAVAMAVFFLIVRRWPAEPPADRSARRLPARMAVPLPGIALALRGARAAGVVAAGSMPMSRRVEQASRHELPRSVAGWIATGPNRARRAAIRERRPRAAPPLRRRRCGDRCVRRRLSTADAGQGTRRLRQPPCSARICGGRETARTEGGWLEVQAQDRAGGRWLRCDPLSRRRRHRHGYRPCADRLRSARSLPGNPVSSALVLRSRCHEDCVKPRDDARPVRRRCAPRIRDERTCHEAAADRHSSVHCRSADAIDSSAPNRAWSARKTRWRAGDHRAAVVELMNALKKEPGNANARLLLAESAFWLGDPGGARARARAASRRRSDPARRAAARDSYRAREGTGRGSRASGSRIRAADPGRGSASCISAPRCCRLRQPNEARRAFRGRCRRGSDARSKRSAGALEARRPRAGDRDAVRSRDSRELTKSHPDSAAAWISRTACCSPRGDTARGADALGRRERTRATPARCHAAASRCSPRWSRRGLREARSMTRRSAADNTRAPRARLARWRATSSSRIAMATNDYAAAVSELRKVVEVAPGLAAGAPACCRWRSWPRATSSRPARSSTAP